MPPAFSFAPSFLDEPLVPEDFMFVGQVMQMSAGFHPADARSDLRPKFQRTRLRSPDASYAAVDFRRLAAAENLNAKAPDLPGPCQTG
jgi:hypothetical protein